MKKNYPLLIIAIFLLACNSENKDVKGETKSNSGFDMQKSRAYIDSINLKFTEAISKGDSTWIASQYSDDAEVLMEGMETIRGKDILSMWGGVARSNTRDWTFTTTDLQGDENFLVETGTYEIKDANKKLSSRGKYIVVWKNYNGTWKLYRDMGASSPLTTK